MNTRALIITILKNFYKSSSRFSRLHKNKINIRALTLQSTLFSWKVNISLALGTGNVSVSIDMQDGSPVRCLSHQDAGYRYTKIIRTSGNKESFCVPRKANSNSRSTTEKNSNWSLFVSWNSIYIDLTLDWVFYNNEVSLPSYYVTQ